MTWPYDCPHVSGDRGAARCRLLGSAGCPVYWRTGACAVCLGEWGAWRAVVIDILHRVAYEEGKIGYESWWPSVAIIRTELAAVGWSP